MTAAAGKAAANFALFQAAWLVCALAPRPWDLLGGALALALQFAFICAPREWRVVAAVIAVGGAIDTALAAAGIIHFDAAVAPPWLLLLWANFAATLRHSLAWLSRRAALAAVCGAIAGPVAYGGGAAISDKLEIAVAPVIFIAVHAPIWAALAAFLPPLAVKLANPKTPIIK